MENEIELLKKEYLATRAPMEATEGFADVLLRLEKPAKPAPFYKNRLIYIGFALVILVATTSFVLFPESKAVSAIKAASQNSIKALFHPTTPQKKVENTILKKKPSSTPTLHPTSKPTSAPGIEISTQKKLNNPTTNDEKVKGASTFHKTTVIPPTQNVSNGNPGQGEAHKNENAQEKSNNSANNPTTEKLNGKNRN